METTILVLESGRGTYYFDENNESKKINVSWHEKKIHTAQDLTAALLWFINTHTDYKIIE